MLFRTTGTKVTNGPLTRAVGLDKVHVYITQPRHGAKWGNRGKQGRGRGRSVHSEVYIMISIKTVTAKQHFDNANNTFTSSTLHGHTAAVLVMHAHQS